MIFDEKKYIYLETAGLRAGLDLAWVARLIPCGKIHPVPRVKDFFLGVCPYGDAALPVVDPARIFTGPRKDRVGKAAKDDLVLVLEKEGDLLGLLCRNVLRFGSKRDYADANAPPPLRGPAGSFLSPLGEMEGRELYLLDVERFFLYVAGTNDSNLTMEA